MKQQDNFKPILPLTRILRVETNTNNHFITLLNKLKMSFFNVEKDLTNKLGIVEISLSNITKLMPNLMS